MTKDERKKILAQLKERPILTKAYLRLLKEHSSEKALTLIDETFFKDIKYDK